LDEVGNDGGDCAAVVVNRWAAVAIVLVGVVVVVVGRPQGLLICGRLEVVAEKLSVEKGELGMRSAADEEVAAAVGLWPYVACQGLAVERSQGLCCSGLEAIPCEVTRPSAAAARAHASRAL
jgi:hypothetical protein